LGIDQGKGSKLEKVNDGLYVEHWKDGSQPFNWFKEPSYLWMTLHDIRLSAQAFVNSDGKEPQFARSIDAVGKLERRRDVEVWQAEAGSSKFSSVKVGLRTDPNTAVELTPGVLMHMVGSALNYGSEKEEPHLRFELYLPKALMEQLRTEAANPLVAKVGLAVKVEVFQSEVERSLAEPWHHQTYCIENSSVNVATFNLLRFEQSAAAGEPQTEEPGESDRSFNRKLEKWIQGVTERVKERSNKGLARYNSAAINTARAATNWLKERDSSLDGVEYKLDQAENFVGRLDEFLHNPKGPFASEGHGIWFHRDINSLYITTKASQRSYIVDRQGLESLASEYIQQAWLQNPYLDWVFVDALAFAETVATCELLRKSKFGWRYAAADGSEIKMHLYKLATFAASCIGIAFFWFLPAYVYYISYDSAPGVATGLAALYYAALIWGLVKSIGRKIGTLFARGPTAIQSLEALILEMAKTYHLLGGQSIHVGRLRKSFDKAFNAGVLWDQQIFYILDKLAERKPTTWGSSIEATYSESARPSVWEI